jgi:hypothetical protein
MENKKEITDKEEQSFLIEKYLKNPNLFNEITEIEFDKFIVGEIPTRKAIFLCSCGRLVENSQIASYNLLITSSAGAGKDYIVGNILRVIPKEEYIKRTRISPTAFTYWHNSKNDKNWTWNGKVFYTEDISEGVLNSDVFKVMCSSGSSTTIVIDQEAIDIHIEGKPVIITTTANAVPSPELTRRFEFCNLDECENQTEDIMKRHSEYAQIGIIPDYNLDYTKAMTLLKRVKVKIPFAKRIYKSFPRKNIMMRTKYPRFLDFIKSSCAFHQYQRKTDEEGYLLAEEQDYEIARIVLKKLTSNKYLIPLTINQQKIIKFFEECPTSELNCQEALSYMNNIMALNNFTNNLNLLVHYGLLESRLKEGDFHRQVNVYKLSETLTKHDIFDLPIFSKLE